MLDDLLARTTTALGRAIETSAFQPQVREFGIVTEVSGGIARVRGLRRVQADELVECGEGLEGLAFDLDADDVAVLLLGPAEGLAPGAEVRATGRLVDAPVGQALLGRVIDASGRPLDGGPIPSVTERWTIERPAPAIMDRAPVARPLLTGLKAIDALIPIGRGQRTLVVGDRQTGKTTVALDAVLNQRDQGVLCIYCAIGQRGTAVARVVEILRSTGALAYSIVVVAAGEDTPGMQFVTPYAATTMAEYFVAQGRDVLIVYDDLTRHARAYRELSLLLRRPPGREAYPGDVFYLHSRLLERSTQLAEAQGGGSLTALPIVETQAQDISAYTPTNLISITDGQIYLSPDLFRRGVLPAVDVGRSVSRVGGRAQLPAFRAVAGDLRLAYSQFEELESFARFATRLDDDTRRIIGHGRRVRAVLAQPEHDGVAAAEQVALFHALNQGVLDATPPERLTELEAGIRAAVREGAPGVCARVQAGHLPDAADWEALLAHARSAAAALATGPAADQGRP